MPGCFGGIIAGLKIVARFCFGDIDGRDSPSPRITAGLVEDAGELHLTGRDAGLFLQLPAGCLLQPFVLLHKTSRQSPASLIRLAGTLYEQQVPFSLARTEDDRVGRYGRPWVRVRVAHRSSLF